jgi:hypothetical protein
VKYLVIKAAAKQRVGLRGPQQCYRMLQKCRANTKEKEQVRKGKEGMKEG